MIKDEYLTIPQAAKILKISRIAVYKRVKKGRIKARKIGRFYAIKKTDIIDILESGLSLSEKRKKEIKDVVKKTLKDYGDTIRWLGNE